MFVAFIAILLPKRCRKQREYVGEATSYPGWVHLVACFSLTSKTGTIIAEHQLFYKTK